MPSGVKKDRFFRISLKSEDRGVAEVVGAILLFAVVITLFTSFMVWYIPAQSSANETHYELQDKAAMGNLVSALHSSSSTSGSTISSTVPLGISGVSIFSQAQDTQFFLLPQSTSFNATMTFSLVLNLTGNSGFATHYLNVSHNLSGIMATSGSTQYITAINYLVEDGSLFQAYGNNRPSNNLGPLPIGLSGGTGHYSVSLWASELSGSSETFSSTGSQVVNLLVNATTLSSYVNGSTTSISGTSYSINSISLLSLNYTFRGNMANAWNYAFYSQYNGTVTPYSTLMALSGWNFARSPLIASSFGNAFSVAFSGNMSLASFSSQYSNYQPD